ncbi:MAG: ABC transporter permease [Chloroflexota bacterium]
MTDAVVIAGRSGWRTRWRAVLRMDPLALAGLVVVAGLAVVALLGPAIAPYPDQGTGTANVAEAMQAPGPGHLLGTDQLGRDVLSRIIVGARNALGVSLAVVGLAIAIGVPLGAIAGYRRGAIDAVIMRATDLALAFPPLLLAMAIVAALGPGLEHAALALAISWWPWYARLARAAAVSLRERPFVEAARAIGVSDRRIIIRHVIPNSLSPIIVQATVDIGTVILAAGSLAFIGLGARAPQADWGLMVAEGRTVILDQWWIPTFPGLAIFVSVLAFNLVGDGLRDRFDPRRRR